MGIKALDAVWTPHAEVLCAICADRESERRYEDVAQALNAKAARPVEVYGWRRGDTIRVTVCDKCGRMVQGSGEAIALHILHQRIAGSRMNQTGGMCACLSVAVGEDHVAIVTEGSSDTWYCCLWTNADWSDGGGPDYDGPKQEAECDTDAEVESKIRAWGETL